MSTSVCVCRYACVSVCLFCLSVRERIPGTACAISTNFSVHVAYGRGLVLLRQGDEKGNFGVVRTFRKHW